jgi:hypothetical protein
MKNKTGGLIERKLSRKEFYDSFIRLLEANYSEDKQLTNSEREVLVEFMALAHEDLKYKYNILGNIAKTKVAAKLKINKPNLEFRLHGIRKKGYLKKDIDNIESLDDVLNRIVSTNSLEITIQYKIEEDGR